MSLELYEDEKFNYMFEIDILENSSQNFLGVLRGAFLGFGCPKRHPDALLAKTMFLYIFCSCMLCILLSIILRQCMMNKRILSFSQIQSLLFRPFGAKTGRILLS